MQRRSGSPSDEFIDELGTLLRSCFCSALRHFSDSVQLDVQSREEPSMANSFLVVEGSWVAGTPGV